MYENGGTKGNDLLKGEECKLLFYKQTLVKIPAAECKRSHRTDSPTAKYGEQDEKTAAC